MKVVKNILIIVCVFFFCWMFYIVFSLVVIFYGEVLLNKIFIEIFLMFLFLGYFNFVFNLLLYIFYNKWFKEIYVKFFGFKCRKMLLNCYLNVMVLSNIDGGLNYLGGLIVMR